MIVCVNIPVFEVDVYFVTDKAEAKAFIQEHSVVEDDGDAVDGAVGACYNVTDKEGRHHRMMCVFDGRTNTIIHEAVHMAWMTLDHCGVKTGQANQEPLAFLAAWLAEEMMKFICGEAKEKPAD